MKNTLTALLLLASYSLYSCKAGETSCIDESRIDADAACIQIYDPVCGCDGKTYGNSCVADNAGVTSYTKGECSN